MNLQKKQNAKIENQKKELEVNAIDSKTKKGKKLGAKLETRKSKSGGGAQG